MCLMRSVVVEKVLPRINQEASRRGVIRAEVDSDLLVQPVMASTSSKLP